MSSHDSDSKKEHARKTFLPVINNAPPPPKDSGADRCELCVYWHMRDPRQKNKSCFERGFESHDLCKSYTRKPDRVRHDLIQHVQGLTTYEVDVLDTILSDRYKQIAQANKIAIRQFIRKTGGAVVRWRDEKGKRQAAKVERVTASNVLLKKHETEKIRVTEVIEVMSKEEYEARKSGKVREREDLGRKIKK